jgi:hypothetical protein
MNLRQLLHMTLLQHVEYQWQNGLMFERADTSIIGLTHLTQRSLKVGSATMMEFSRHDGVGWVASGFLKIPLFLDRRTCFYLWIRTLLSGWSHFPPIKEQNQLKLAVMDPWWDVQTVSLTCLWWYFDIHWRFEIECVAVCAPATNIKGNLVAHTTPGWSPKICQILEVAAPTSTTLLRPARIPT